MEINNQSEFILGVVMATFFWGFTMFFAVGCAYDHGKYVGKLEAAVPEAAAPQLATEKEAENEKKP